MLGYSNRKVWYTGDWVLVKKTVYLQKQIHIQMLSNIVLEFIILKLNDGSINLGNFYYERFQRFWRFLRLCAGAKSRGIICII